MANTQYSYNYKKRMDELFKIKPKEEIKSKEEKEIKEKEIISRQQPVKIIPRPIKKRKPTVVIIFSIILILLLVIIYFLSFVLKSYSYYVIILILVVVAMLFFLFHRKYEKWIVKVNKNKILILVYIILILNMIFGMKFYPIEWAFLGFVLCAVIFYDSKIDSRFLIFPALLLLGYIPFLLIGKQNSLAETIAVYVYYFLVVGVGLQVAEYINKSYNSIDFENFFWEIIEKINWITAISIVGIISLAIIIANRFYDLEIWKWTFVYVFVVCLVFYFIPYVRNK